MNTPDTEWEKEFDVIFPQFLEYPDSFTTQFETDPANRRKIKDFITKTISSRDTYWKERVRKEVEGIRKEIVNTCFYIDKKGFCKECIIKKYNQILDTRLENLTKGE